MIPYKPCSSLLFGEENTRPYGARLANPTSSSTETNDVITEYYSLLDAKGVRGRCQVWLQVRVQSRFFFYEPAIF
jgi:hypothetical protein